jgi:hypothetical protein
LQFPLFTGSQRGQDSDSSMLALALIALFLATPSLASPVGRQTSLCPWNGVPNANNFTLLAVFKTDTSIQKPLALGSSVFPGFSSLAWLGVFT